MDITIEVISRETKHTLTAEKEAARYKVGEILDIHMSDGLVPKVKGEYVVTGIPEKFKTMFIHITGVPVSREGFEVLRDKLTRVQMIPVVESMHSRRAWRVDIDAIPATAKDKLLAEKQINVTWTAAKPFIKKTDIQATYTKVDRNVSDSDL